MEGILVDVSDLCEGSVLAYDVFVERRKLVTSGSIVTPQIINVLKRRNVQSVEIVAPKINKDIDSLDDIIAQMSGIISQQSIFEDDLEFLTLLSELNIEKRYGKALHQVDAVQYTTQIFHCMMQYDICRENLKQLKAHDRYTFLHSVDVFTLCTLFAKKEGFTFMDELAIGFLFHDIGKLNTPQSILKKRGKLTKEETDIIQKHPADGEAMLCEMGMESVAYLAKLHHERKGGQGYPTRACSLQLPLEVQILQLVDVYSAVTLDRPYRNKVSVSDAVAILYKDRALFDEDLLNRFVDFIGIYPRNTVVLLSDGSHAAIEKSNEINPLLPTVRQFHSGRSFSIPHDFKLSILKMVSYHAETPADLFIKFSEYLINGDEALIKNYYDRLKDHYETYEWFTHIHIPIFQIFNVLQKNQIVEQYQLQEISEKFTQLLMHTMIQMRIFNKRKEKALFVVSEAMQGHVTVQLLEGLFYSEEVQAIIVGSDITEKDLQELLTNYPIQNVYMIGKQPENHLLTSSYLNLYQLTGTHLESFLCKMSSAELQHVSLLENLQPYKINRESVYSH